MTLRFTTFLIAALMLAAPARAIDFNPFSAIKGAVEAAVEDRSASDIATDTRIKAAITADVIGKLGSDVISINSDVYEQDVMLTGAVKTQKIKDDAERLTKAVKDVKKIYNEILVIPAGAEQKGAVANLVDDSVIEGKINALLVEAKGINATNFRWRAVGGKVFLFGRALTKAESDKVAQVVKGIDKVIAVVNRVKIKPKG